VPLRQGVAHIPKSDAVSALLKPRLRRSGAVAGCGRRPQQRDANPDPGICLPGAARGHPFDDQRSGSR